ncbi:MAG: TrmH family RNA methyltransferase [Bacteroidota bacterium]
MPSIAQIKHIASLRMPKFRQKYGQFVVEGRKAVEEVFHSGWQVEGIWATQGFADRHAPGYPFQLMSEEENKKCTAFDTAPGVMALVNMPKYDGLRKDMPFILALDGINDPGNMGTIIRLADWFGLTQIVASPDSVDAFNPKCLAATMGSFLRVAVVYAPLDTVAAGKTVYGAYLHGENVHGLVVAPNSMLLIGSESHGIREAAAKLVTHPITIPGKGQAESLNAGMATAILLDNLLR